MSIRHVCCHEIVIFNIPCLFVKLDTELRGILRMDSGKLSALHSARHGIVNAACWNECRKWKLFRNDFFSH